MKSVLIIYPHDPTTYFLLDSFQGLKAKFESVTFYEVKPNDASHEECFLLISKHETIVFMGHGSHQKLSGSRNNDYSKDYLISLTEILELDRKNWILFSCNSNDLLDKCSSTINSGIGFGDLPTDFTEIQGLMEYDSSAYKNINKEIISDFKQSINWLILESISKFIGNNLTSFELFHFIKILLTRRMLDVLSDPKNINQKEHAKLLFEMKHDMILSNNN